LSVLVPHRWDALHILAQSYQTKRCFVQLVGYVLLNLEHS
jgi:hypothetical protein